MAKLGRVLLTLALLIAAPAHAEEEPTTVLVIQHRWHTGIILPADRVTPTLGFLQPHYTDPEWYEFGWGDSKFYRSTESLWLMARAMFWPTNAVMHVVGYEGHPERQPHTDIEALCLSLEETTRLLDALAADFRTQNDGRPSPLEDGLYGDSHFFPAHGTFWFGRTCNTWTAQRLQQAGVDIRAFMTLSAESVMGQLRATAETGACGE